MIRPVTPDYTNPALTPTEAGKARQGRRARVCGANKDTS